MNSVEAVGVAVAAGGVAAAAVHASETKQSRSGGDGG